MSRENVELVIQYYEAPDLASAIDLLADDVTFTFYGESRSLAGAATISGRKEAVKWLADWFSRFDPDYRMEIEETRDLGDRVLVVTNHHATGRTSGVPIDQKTTQIMAFEAGKIARQEFFATLDEALASAGLSE
jgi:ketosteroid isomerase-like protein